MRPSIVKRASLARRGEKSVDETVRSSPSPVRRADGWQCRQINSRSPAYTGRRRKRRVASALCVPFEKERSTKEFVCWTRAVRTAGGSSRGTARERQRRPIQRGEARTVLRQWRGCKSAADVWRRQSIKTLLHRACNVCNRRVRRFEHWWGGGVG